MAFNKHHISGVTMTSVEAEAFLTLGLLRVTTHRASAFSEVVSLPHKPLQCIGYLVDSLSVVVYH